MPSGWPPSSARPPASCWPHGAFGVLVVLGGDTAAAVLGDEPMVVGGTLAPGVPWSRRADGSGPLVITKAGGFGHPTTLVDLLAGRARERGAMTTERIPMAVTMGDPSGVGPEIVLRHFAAGGLGDDVVVYGDAAILAHGAELLGLDVDLDVVGRDAVATRRPGALAVVDAGLLDRRRPRARRARRAGRRRGARSTSCRPPRTPSPAGSPGSSRCR